MLRKMQGNLENIIKYKATLCFSYISLGIPCVFLRCSYIVLGKTVLKQRLGPIRFASSQSGSNAAGAAHGMTGRVLAHGPQSHMGAAR